ncbi:MAG: PKD domain-containing protein, partial [Calditrichaeota bacterium]|nr:PKD domain-containing protein [Calditrichota bacterium]
NDGTDFGTLQTSSTVTVGSSNTPPTATNLTITPANPLTGDDLVGSYTYNDADSDPESGTEIRWYKDGANQAAYNNLLTVPSSATAHGQKWYFTVHPNDGKEFGTLATSDTVTIGNTAPDLDPIADQNLDEGQTVNVNVSATDADGDEIALSLKDNPTFVTLTDNGDGTGVVHIAPGYSDAGTYNNVKVIATDNYTAALADTEAFNIIVNDVPQNPTADAGGPYAGVVNVEMHFDGSGSSDSDGTIASYEWDFGDGDSGTGETATHTYSAEGTFQVILKVTDNDGLTDSDTTSAVITLVLPEANFYGSPTEGYPDLTVRFEDDSEGDPTAWYWDFGDGETSTEKNPTHSYSKSGQFDVSLTITTAAGKDTTMKENFINVLGYGPIYNASLELVDNSTASPKESWDNAIDNDTNGWDGTVTADGNPPFAIFKFKDGTSKRVNKVKLLTDTGVEFSDRWVRNFSVFVSTTGIADGDFTQVLDASKIGGDWQDFPVDPVMAKYIKLVLDQPNSGWRQIGEFQVCPDRQFAEPTISTVTATSPHVGNGVDASSVTITVKDADGNPITGLTNDDFALHATYSGAIYFPIVESSTPGTYTTQLASLGGADFELEVFINGVLIGSPALSFTQPELQTANLVFLEGSDTFEGEGWDNAIDEDIEGWDGTVTMTGSHPYAIFGFEDGQIKAVQKVNLLVDTGVYYENRWVKRFRIQVSTSGMKDTDFHTVYDGLQVKNGWQQHIFPAANAKYVKLIVDYPVSGKRQIGEFEVEVGEALTVRLNGTSSSDLVSVIGTPEEFSVNKNYPNPFNPDTKIEFALPEQNHVTIELYNMLGQHVRTLLDASLGAGYHAVTWNGRNDAAEQLPSGTYFMRLVAGKHTIIQKLMMLK